MTPVNEEGSLFGKQRSSNHLRCNSSEEDFNFEVEEINVKGSIERVVESGEQEGLVFGGWLCDGGGHHCFRTGFKGSNRNKIDENRVDNEVEDIPEESNISAVREAVAMQVDYRSIQVRPRLVIRRTTPRNSNSGFGSKWKRLKEVLASSSLSLSTL
ncbi:hypothetical protein F3Y22_tig00111402pilonHSYRG00332 [Hibiscus syriacus]|uniref:Uncharacterized protein n=1 Tax=Hibiscus syriacus TaxID=106335 RepID=A0A6A2Y4D8_HIBSY|nr:hypothetical protein F3Y22_tig00111402pilonHSYRG00332 [Hibiscus syriacus]